VITRIILFIPIESNIYNLVAVIILIPETNLLVQQKPIFITRLSIIAN
jgi:hypothetical protein